MPRPLRLQAPNTTYHVTGNSTHRCRLFAANRDRERFTEILAGAIEKYEWTCLAFALMDTHYLTAAGISFPATALISPPEFRSRGEVPPPLRSEP